MKGKGGTKKNSRYKKQQTKDLYKKSKLNYTELKDSLQKVICSLNSLLQRYSEKTELATFLCSVASQFCFEENDSIDGDSNSAKTVNIQDELEALRYKKERVIH